MGDVLHSEDIEDVISCELCSGTRLQQVRVCSESRDAALIREMRGDRDFPVVRCRRCGLAFVSPRYRKEKLLRLYGDDYFEGSDSVSATARTRYWNKEAWMSRHGREASLLKVYLSGGRILDAGCGPGWFSDALGPGFEVTGVDWSKRGVALARQRSACSRVVCANIEEDDLGENIYDGVVLAQVLDHLRRPAVALRNLAGALRPGGVLLITRLVNLAAPLSRLFGNDFRLLAPNHLYYFTPSTIRRMLDATGFETLAVTYPFVTTGAFTPSWFVRAPLTLLQRILGGRPKSPPGPGNLMNVAARKQ